MLEFGSLRSALLIGLSTVLLGFTATASAAKGANVPGASTTPSLGEPLAPSSPEQKALSDHLRAKGAIFYGAWWCPACFQQKNLFGKEAGNTLPYVECDKTDPGRARCQAAQIRAYPTWDQPGKERREGVQTLQELKVWSGFPGSTPKKAALQPSQPEVRVSLPSLRTQQAAAPGPASSLAARAGAGA